MKTALVSIVFGEQFQRNFNSYSRAGWEEYCTKFNFDLVIIDQLLDSTDRAKARSVSWQKLLILSQDWSAKYDRIIWVDSDIIINTTSAGDITLNVPIDKVGAVDAGEIPSKEFHQLAMDRLYDHWTKTGVRFLDNKTAGKYYTNRGISGGHLNNVVQAGVLVLSPKYHRTIFEKVYCNYEDTHGGEWNYEMPALSYELLMADLVHWISPRYNLIVTNTIEAFYFGIIKWNYNPLINFASRVSNKLFKIKIPQKIHPSQLQVLKSIYDLSMFMHFAGYSDDIPKMAQIIKKDDC